MNARVKALLLRLLPVAIALKVSLAQRRSLKEKLPEGCIALNPWLYISRDNIITLRIDRAEMGQGIVTALSQLVAEELAVDITQIRTEFAPVHAIYTNQMIGIQVTGGSTSVRDHWTRMRQLGANAREALRQAAAQTWQVALVQCQAKNGEIWHLASERRLTYGELAERAASLPKVKAKLKDPQDFRIIGSAPPRLEIPDMVQGKTQYGIDVEVPGMLFASILHCPILAGQLQHVDSERAAALAGVQRVLPIDGGIAVVAENIAAAQQGRNLLRATWQAGKMGLVDSDIIRQKLRQALQRKGAVALQKGRPKPLIEKAAQILEARYETPFLAHGTMEPMSCTAHVTAQACEVWVGTQAQSLVQSTAAKITGLPKAAIRVHSTFLGGGFGRRIEQDYVTEAVQLAKTMQAPVQVLWTRGDDLQHDHYRPANANSLRAITDHKGLPLAWWQRIAGPALALEGNHVPYDIPHLREEHVQEKPGITIGHWRSVGASQNSFAVESFIDELAHAHQQDPLDYRLALLQNAPRGHAVLTLAAEKAAWRAPSAKGHYQGLALCHCFETWIAQVAEVSIVEGQLKVHQITCAIDCGQVIHPNNLMAQVEGAVIFGLSAALYGEITIKEGRVQQSSFKDYPILTMAQSPKIEVHIVASTEAPGGAGEVGVPPVAPAVANAMFAATGQRLRRLPLSPAIGDH